MEFFKTKDECKRAAKTLREAKKHLWVKTYKEYDEHPVTRKKYCSEYICDCVNYVASNDFETRQITDWISYQLGGKFGLEYWLASEKHYAGPVDLILMEDEDFLKLQRTRIAWMNWMIAELEAKAEQLK